MSSGRDELNSEVEQLLRSLEQEAARLDTLPLLGVLTQNQSATSTFAALLDLGRQRISTAKTVVLPSSASSPA